MYVHGIFFEGEAFQLAAKCCLDRNSVVPGPTRLPPYQLGYRALDKIPSANDVSGGGDFKH